jgi:hypothetical protein
MKTNDYNTMITNSYSIKIKLKLLTHYDSFVQIGFGE